MSKKQIRRNKGRSFLRNEWKEGEMRGNDNRERLM